jgi:hypothetical protein
MSGVEVRAVGRGASVSDWIAVPPLVHANDPHFVRELDLKERMRVSRRFNPFFDFGEACLFVACRDGVPVGRISAQVNRLHRARHEATAGHFGFFACLDDQDAANALFDAARAWLAARGSSSISGPFSFSINEESGLLVEGFDEPAAMLMNQAMPFTGTLVERAGLSKVMDTFAFRVRGTPEVQAFAKLAASAGQQASIVLREVNVRRFEEEVRLIVDIFNDAWSDNWNFVPFSEGEIIAMARELKTFYAPGYGRFVEIDGRPIAFFLAMPDLNGVTARFGGRLLPFNWWRLIRDLRLKRFRSARVPLLGVRKAYQGSLLAAGILALLTDAFLKEARHYDLDWVEFSWVLETNRAMLNIAQLSAGPPVKRYRFYEGKIG